MTSERRRLARHAAANYAGQLTPIAVGLLLTPFMLHSLGPELYGVWALVVAVQGLGGALDLGLASSIVKFVSAHDARDEDQEIAGVIATSVSIHLVIGAAVLAVFAVLLAAMPTGAIGGDDDAVVRLALAVGAVTVAFGLPLGALGSVLLGFRGYGPASAVNVVTSVASAVATVIALVLGAGPVVVVAIGGIGGLLGHVAKAAWASRIHPGIRIRRRDVTRATLRRIGSFSVWLFVVDAGKKVFYNLDAVVIALLMPISAVGVYNVAFKAASGASFLSGPFVQVLFPAASAYDARAEGDRLRDLVVDGTRLSLVLTLPAVAWLLVFGPAVLTAWVGPGFATATPVLRVLAVVFLFAALQAPSAVVLRGIGRVRAIAGVVAVEYAINIALTITLVPWVGIVGAALGTLVPITVSSLALVPLLACRAVGVPYRTFLRRAVLGPALVGLASVATLEAARTVIDEPGWPSVIAGGLVAVALVAGLYLALAASRRERSLVAGLITGTGRMLAGRAGSS